MFKELNTLGERYSKFNFLLTLIAISTEIGIVGNANLAWLYHKKT